MTTVTVRPPVVDACDILEYARALLQEHGWRQGPRERGDGENWDAIAAKGLSLHDAIGMACFRLSGISGATLTGREGRSSKEFGHPDGSLRFDTTQVLANHLPRGQNDIEFNDAARDVNDVLAVLDSAIAEECK